jgi:hypothetical protein
MEWGPDSIRSVDPDSDREFFSNSIIKYLDHKKNLGFTGSELVKSLDSPFGLGIIEYRSASDIFTPWRQGHRNMLYV